MTYWQDNYDSEPEDPNEIILKEDEEFDQYYDSLQQEYNNFVDSAPQFTLDLLTVNDYENLINGDYIPKQDYQNIKIKNKYDDNIGIIPEPMIYIPEPETDEDKKGWIYLKSGKWVYPELHEKKVETPKAPTPKTKIEEILIDTKEAAKKTGTTWGNTPTAKITNLENIQKKAEKDLQRQREEQERKEKEKKERKRREQELRERKERQRIEREERRRRQRDQQQKRNRWRTTIKKRNGGGSNRFRNMFD